GEVAAGRAEFGVGTSALLLDRARGRDLVSLAQVFQHSAAVVLAPRRAGITSVAGLAGRRVMYSNQHGDILALLRKHGLQEGDFVSVEHRGDPRDLLAGRADAMVAYAFNEPFVLDQAGEAYLAFTPRASGFDFYGDNLFTTRALAEARPAFVAAFREATLRGWRHALAHKEAAADLILARYSQARTREWLLFEANQVEALVQPDLVELGYQSATRWRRIGEVFTELGMLPAGFDASGVMWAPRPATDYGLVLGVAGAAGVAIAVLVALVVVFRGINARLKAEAAERQASARALAERETLLRTLFDAAPVGIMLLDRTGTITLVNPAGQAIWGGVRHVGMDRVAEYRGWRASDGRPLANEDWGSTRAVTRGEASYDEEVEIEAFDGARKVIANSAVPLRDEAGAITGAVVIIQDITARKRAERSLRESEARLRSALDAMPVAIGVTTGERIEYVNATFERQFGYGLADVPDVGTWLRLAYPDPAYRASLGEAWARAVAAAMPTGERLPSFEARIRCKDGSERHVIIDAQPFREQLLAIFTDLTERERMQAEILKLQKLESVGVLAGGIAHDFNNLLTGILGNVSLARSLLGPAQEAAQVLEEAERASRRAAELARQLLTFAKGSEPVKRAVSVRALVESCTSLVLRGTRAALRLELPERLADVEADEGQLGQALTNVVLNAVQAMPDGGTITIGAAEVRVAAGSPLVAPGLAPGAYVRLEVSDTGEGIPEADLQRIFDPFFTTKPSGTGLGLASVHSILRKHGGLVTARSRVGQGTTLELWLPVSAGRAMAPPPAAEAVSSPAAAGQPILVMDDEPAIRQVARRSLERLGHPGSVCADGAEAVAAYLSARAAGRPFAAVIMDLTIRGGMGGAEAAARILREDPSARLVVSSGYSTDPVLAEHARHGFVATLDKPYQVTGVAAVLARVLG
ncbi:MAG: ABC transporter substrate-binding protein, partial [Anaeromyxobacteraceae bacterium]|nr:ABC transporter substrate-binding protein [Anaeromyxobacteraceae bacterium]